MNINDKLTQDLAKTVEQVIENKEEENLEEAFMRLPSTVIGTDLFVLQRDLKDFMYSQMKNRDFNPKQFDNMIKRMEFKHEFSAISLSSIKQIETFMEYNNAS